MQNALSYRNATKKYPEFMLGPLNFNVPRGCIMGLIGENGAGKTTALKMALGMKHKTGGNIELLGCEAGTLSNIQKEQIGAVMEGNFFPENLSSIQIGKIMKNLYTHWDKDGYLQHLKRFDIPANRSIKECSKGTKMKISIAVALSHGAQFLLLDEATSGLDPIMRDEVLSIFLEFIQDENHTILISSHILSDLEKICDYITFMHQGQILLSQPKDELLDQYGILKCSLEQLAKLDPARIQGARKNSFGAEVLVIRREFPELRELDRPTIEEIMLFKVRGDKQ